ncbi:MAG TPA: CoA ester lyase [Allosphingosinicella sp.]|nr:CoA ester lyase [Allosphingosinicella sp.]
MTPSDLRLCRSLLFLPASNPRAIEKARSLAADLIILDCEDAVKPQDKEAARQAAIDAAARGFEGRACAIRVNAPGTPWYDADVAAMGKCRADFVILPKVEDGEQAREASRLAEKPLLAMIETAGGVLNSASIAPRTVGLIAGTNDLAADLGIPAGAGRGGLSHSLQAVVLAARKAGIAAFDGVYNKLEDDEGLRLQCEEGRAFGFDGKSLIHPNQIETANRVFGPGDEEVAAARRLLDAATGGAERFEGRMIESMHVEQARAVLAKARR